MTMLRNASPSIVGRALACLSLALAGGAASIMAYYAQAAFPSKAIRITVPSSLGGRPSPAHSP